MNINGRIYFDIQTGNVVLYLPEQINTFGVIKTTVEHDIYTLKQLSERNRNTFDVIELEFGQYAQDFATCSGYSVDIVTKELMFSYPDPTQPDQPIVTEKPLTVQLEEQKKRNDDLEAQVQQVNTDLSSFMDFVLNGGM